VSAVGRSSAAAGPSAWRGGERHGRSGARRLIIVFAVVFLILTGLAVLGALVKAPATPKSVCPSHQECTNPPRRVGLPSGPALAAPLLAGDKLFVSPGLGYRIEYPDGIGIDSHTAANVELKPTSGSSFIVLLKGAPAAQATPQQLLAAMLSDLHATIPDLQADSDASTEILAPALAGHAGVGGFYQGNFDAPSGPVSPVDVAVLASTDGHQTLATAVISANRAQTGNFFTFADQTMLDTLRFKADLPG
jgi:hypothetical protein